MILELSPSCPIFAEDARPSLHQLLAIASRGWHVIASPAPASLKRLLSAEAWAIYGQVISQGLKVAVRTQQPRLSVADCDKCDPVGLAAYCSEPVQVVVENINSDGAFFLAMITKLDYAAAQLLTPPGPLRFYNGGGITVVPSVIEQLSGQMRKIRPQGPSVPPRIIAIVDSDATAPGLPSAAVSRVIRAADNHGVPYHVLSKRSIENYLPDEVLLAYARKRADRSAAIRAIVGLDPKTRDHYPMKTGFPKDEDGEKASAALGIAPCVGIGDCIGDILSEAGHELAKSGIRARDSQGEWDTIVRLIRESY